MSKQLTYVDLVLSHGPFREQRKTPQARQVDASLAAENRRLQAELRRVTEERDILKKAAAYFAKG